MKSDTQHLDFLISQYIDGCLDTGSKKSLEQRLLNDPQGRKLYKEQRDVQDLLDEWGNRIPLINWEQFDKKLTQRLANETVGGQKPSIFRRWSKVMAAAAALFIAATIGYAWHAWSNPRIGPGEVAVGATTTVNPVQSVKIIDDRTVAGQPWIARVKIDEPAALSGTTTKIPAAQISSPDDVLAANALEQAVRFGMGADVKSPGSATAMDSKTDNKKDDGGRESPANLPYP